MGKHPANVVAIVLLMVLSVAMAFTGAGVFASTTYVSPWLHKVGLICFLSWWLPAVVAVILFGGDRAAVTCWQTRKTSSPAVNGKSCCHHDHTVMSLPSVKVDFFLKRIAADSEVPEKKRPEGVWPKNPSGPKFTNDLGECFGASSLGPRC
jgi:hypothetical protein